jgi:hypothetical protein
MCIYHPIDFKGVNFGPWRLIVLAALCIILSGTFHHGSAQSGVGDVERDIRRILGSQLGTISVQANPSFAEGHLSGCSIEYNVLIQDWTYKQGAFAKISGSIGLMQARDIVALVLKVVIHDINIKGMELTPSPPVDAYYIWPDYTTSKKSKVSSYNSDTPGSIFVVFQPNEIVNLLTYGYERNEVTIAFSRQAAGADVQIPIDLSVDSTSDNGERKRSAKTVTAFLECSTKLFNNLRKQ